MAEDADGQFYNPLSRRPTVDEQAASFETESDGFSGMNDDGQFHNPLRHRPTVDEKVESFETETDVGSSSFEDDAGRNSSRSTQWGQLAAREALYSGDVDTAILVRLSCASSGLCHTCQGVQPCIAKCSALHAVLVPERVQIDVDGHGSACRHLVQHGFACP